MKIERVYYLKKGIPSKKKKCDGVPSFRDCANCGTAEKSVLGIPVYKIGFGSQITFYCSLVIKN